MNKGARKKAIEISAGLFLIWVISYLAFSGYYYISGYYIGRFFWSLLCGIISAPLCLIIADSKNRGLDITGKKDKDPWKWYWLGFFFGVIALIIILFLKDLKKEK